MNREKKRKTEVNYYFLRYLKWVVTWWWVKWSPQQEKMTNYNSSYVWMSKISYQHNQMLKSEGFPTLLRWWEESVGRSVGQGSTGC
jgi:hypothetical protein